MEAITIMKNQINNLPTPSVGGLSLYLTQIKKFPMLDAEEEYMLAKNWREKLKIVQRGVSERATTL